MNIANVTVFHLCCEAILLSCIIYLKKKINKMEEIYEQERNRTASENDIQ